LADLLAKKNNLVKFVIFFSFTVELCRCLITNFGGKYFFPKLCGYKGLEFLEKKTGVEQFLTVVSK